jgi:GntR family transcriptional regulator, rspAB operon transcriptional repressor
MTPLAVSRPGKPTLAQAIYRRLRHQILHGELPPGEFVSERMLAQRLDCGVAPVRVAVQRLSGEGLLSIQPRRGIVVTPQTIQDVVDLFEVRLLIEQRVVRNIAGQLSPSQILELRDSVSAMRQALEAGDVTEVVERDFAFHLQMSDLNGNRHLSGVLERILNGLYREVWTTTSRLPWLTDDVLQKHTAIIQAIEQGDAAEAEHLLEEHLRLGEQCVLSRRPAPPQFL